MKKYLIYIGIVLILLAAGLFYIPGGGRTEKYSERFYRQEGEFEKLVQTLQADSMTYKRPGQLISWKAFSNPTKKQLQQLDVTHVQACHGGLHMDFKTDWRPPEDLHLCYWDHSILGQSSTCGDTHTVIQSLNQNWTLCKKMD